MAQIKVIVEKGSWNIKVEGMGFKGTQCREPIEKLVNRLGAETLSRVPKQDEKTVKEVLKL